MRVGRSMSLNAPYSSPSISDYVKRTSRGKAYGLSSCGYALGYFLATSILFPFTKSMDYKLSFGIASFIGIIITILLLFIIKDPEPIEEQEIASNDQEL
jgi:sugar phosphate permease